MLVLVVGTGSIGRRHIGNLRRLVPDAQFILLRRGVERDALALDLNAQIVTTIDEAIKRTPDIAVVATPSALHFEVLPQLVAAGIPCYVEKPVVTTRAHAAQTRAAAALGPASFSIAGFNMRFLGSLIAARSAILKGRIGNVVRASLSAGQWLPDWRIGKDYREGYNSDKGLGGGVIFDLSHELDVARWFFGEIEIIACRAGKFSTLEIETPDVACILAARPAGPVISISLDYVARSLIRRYEFVGDLGTLVWDLPGSTLEIRSSGKIEAIDPGNSGFDMAASYSDLMKAFLSACEGGSREGLQSLEDGLRSSELAMRATELGDLG